MKALKTLLAFALSGLMLLGGNAMAQVAAKVGEKAPAFTTAKQLTKATGTVAEMKAAYEKEQLSNTKKEAKTLMGQTVEFKTVYQPRAAVKNTKEGAKPTVTLLVEADYFLDGSGQALYLDKDATVYDAVDNGEITQFTEDNLRDWFEYSIPEGALDDPLGADGMVMADDEENEVTIEVEAGVYDIWVANPDPGYGGVYGFGWLPSLSLPEDASLYIVFTMDGKIKVELFMPYDIAVKGIAEPAAFALGLTAEEEFKVIVANNGTERIENFKLHYKFDDGSWNTDEFGVNILPTKTEVVALKTKADLSKVGIHSITVIGELDGDNMTDNDTLYAKVNHVSAVTEFPFVDSFADKDLFPLTWYVEDVNENGLTWRWAEVDEETGDGAAYISYSDASEGMPEPLICGTPFHFTPGIYHLTYKILTSGSWPESYDVIMGTSFDDMKVISSFEEITSPEWSMEVKNIEIETEGDYFLGFQYHYTDALYVYIDDFTVGKGKFIGIPDIQLNALVAPMSSCNLGNEEDVVVSVSNIGYGDVRGLKVTGTINETPFENTLDILIPARTFDQKVTILGKQDFSEADSYNIEVSLEAVIDENEAKPEDSLANNEGQFSFTHWTPASLPFNSNFARNTALSNWVLGNWEYAEDGYVYANDTFPFTSRCMDLEKDHLYRVSLDYAAGLSFLGMIFATEFEVLCGKSGTDWQTWEVIYSDDEAYEDDFANLDLTFEVEESGSYAIALRVTYNAGFYVREIKVSEVMDYDVRINEIYPLPTMIPTDQINTEFSVKAEIENRGKKAVESAKVVININESKVGEATTTDLNVNDFREVAVKMNVSGLNVGERALIEGKAEIDGHEDGIPEDNVTYYGLDVTDDILAYDNVVEEMCTDSYKVVGATNLICLVPINLSVKDTLTGINVWWGCAEGEPEAHATTLVVYNLNMEEGDLGSLIYSAEERKDAMIGEQSFEIPALLLESGAYAIGVMINGYELTVDGASDGLLYYISGGHIVSQSGLGNPGIRAKFGHDGKPMAKDAEVVAITKPGESGYFTANETVVATVRNNGYEELATKFTLSVDGVVKAEENASMAGYHTYALEFANIDLSEIGEHTLTVTAIAEGDEVADNNEISKTVETKPVPTVDPYVMDFEFCEDFAIDNFIPAWKNVDVDGSVTWDIQLADGSQATAEFPHHGEAMAFIAFNGNLFDIGAEAYEGERFGGCIASKNKANDDWLISPALVLPETDASMSLMVKSITSNYGLESYQILVSETEDLESFEKLAEGKAPAEDWTKIEVDLSKYAGKTVYLAVRCVSNDVFMFMVDDIRVSKPVANEKDFAANLKLYPNPARQMITITGAAIESVSIYNVSGRQVFASNSVKGDFRYNVSNLAKGMYFANVKTANGSVVLKFIVE